MKLGRLLYFPVAVLILGTLLIVFYSRSSFTVYNGNRDDENYGIFSGNVSVQRIIHQSWKDDQIPERFRNYSKSWTEFCFKDWTYMFWTDYDNLKLIKTHYPWFLDKYIRLPSSIHRADVSRYFYLLHYGGIYTDLDNECLRPFGHLLENYSLVFGAMRDSTNKSILKNGVVQNSFMYSVPHHPFWLEVIMAVLNHPKDEEPEYQTGPVLLAKVIDRNLKRNGKTTREMKIYEPDYFNPFSWIDRRNLNKHCKDFNEMSYEDWQICRLSMVARGSFVVQYHAHSWKYTKGG